jgi:adenylate cyclase
VTDLEAPPSWPRRPGPVLDWLIAEGRHLRYAQDMLAGLARELMLTGVPVERITFNLRILHPQNRGIGMIWRADRPQVDTIRVGHGIEQTSQYQDSPLRVLFEGAGGLRQRLDIELDDLPFPIYRELRAEGFTDYVALPMTFSDGAIHGSTWATRRAGGFDSEHLCGIDDLLPVVALILEARAIRRLARTLLDTYVGHHAGARILSGQIRRGTGETVRAAVWYCDLRGFTRLTETTPRDALIACLNDYFECMAAEIARADGEILKFMGDGMLALFPLERADACARALAAAEGAVAGMAELNARRAPRGEAALGFGIALHAGEVMYGNIGAPDRLDFTVIGRAVNQAARIEKLCRDLDRHVLISADFARISGASLVSLGRHVLPGVAEPAEVFTLPDAVLRQVG